MKKTESLSAKKEDFTTVRYYFMMFSFKKGFSAETFATFQGFFKKIEAAMTSISEFKKTRNQARTYKSESEQHNAPSHDQRDHASTRHQPHDMLFAASKKKKKIKEKVHYF